MRTQLINEEARLVCPMSQREMAMTLDVSVPLAPLSKRRKAGLKFERYLKSMWMNDGVMFDLARLLREGSITVKQLQTFYSNAEIVKIADSEKYWIAL